MTDAELIEQYNISNNGHDMVAIVTPILNQKHSIQLAICFAEHVFPILERRFPLDSTLKNLIIAGKGYLKYNCSIPFTIQSVPCSVPYADFINTHMYTVMNYPAMLFTVAMYCEAVAYAHTSYLSNGSSKTSEQAAMTESKWQADMIRHYFGKCPLPQSPNDTKLSVP